MGRGGAEVGRLLFGRSRLLFGSLLGGGLLRSGLLGRRLLRAGGRLAKRVDNCVHSLTFAQEGVGPDCDAEVGRGQTRPSGR